MAVGDIIGDGISGGVAFATGDEGDGNPVGASLESSLHEAAEYVKIITKLNRASFIIAGFKFRNCPWQ